MKRLLLTLAVVWLAQSSSFAITAAQRTLCQGDEQVLFSCPVQDGTKIVSLCSSKNLTDKDGYLQYRFGSVGEVELEFPPQRLATQGMFRYSHYFRYQVDRVAVRFDRNGYTYTLFDNYEGDTKPKVRQQGVQISLPGAGRKDVIFLCRGAAIGRLGSLISIVPCDKDDALNMGECR
jgi:hypothetical protein